jgi:hypothetical protein
MIDAQVADAPRTVPLAVPYTHLQTAISLHKLSLFHGLGGREAIFLKE